MRLPSFCDHVRNNVEAKLWERERGEGKRDIERERGEQFKIKLYPIPLENFLLCNKSLVAACVADNTIMSPLDNPHISRPN